MTWMCLVIKRFKHLERNLFARDQWMREEDVEWMWCSNIYIIFIYNNARVKCWFKLTFFGLIQISLESRIIHCTKTCLWRKQQLLRRIFFFKIIEFRYTFILVNKLLSLFRGNWIKKKILYVHIILYMQLIVSM